MRFTNISFNKLAIFAIITGILSLIININYLEFRGEEARRGIIAFEMLYEKNFIQPLFLGDYYFNKPPFFNWLIIISSFFIPWSELTLRIVSILSFALSLFVIYKFYIRFFNDKNGAIFAVLSYLTFLDLLFFYGYLAEIDITFGFIVLLFFYFSIIGFLEKKNFFILISGIIAGFAFLTKGLPAFVFFGLTYLTLIVDTKNFRFIFNPYIWISFFIMLFISLAWIFNTANPKVCIETLIWESTTRLKDNDRILKFLTYLFMFPFGIIKFTIPASLFALYIIFNKKIKPNLDNRKIKLLFLIILINSLPYFLATNSKGRYMIPIFTLLAVLIGRYIYLSNLKIQNIFLYTALFFIIARFLVGLIGFPIYTKYLWISKKAVAEDIYKITNKSEKIAFDCVAKKEVAIYLDFLLKKPIKKPKYLPNWEYYISCKELNLPIVKEYDFKKNYKVILYKKQK